jgi:hypothetical protein
LLAASVIQDQEALATQVLEAVSTLALAAERIPDQVAVHIQVPVVERIQVRVVAHTPDLAVERIPAQVVGHTPDLVVERIPAQAVGHTPDLAAGVIPALVGWQRTSGIARHLIANRKVLAIRRDLSV